MKPENHCFACGEANPDGLHLKFLYDPLLRRVECHLQIDPRYQGATGFAHGGIIATLLDEAMAKVNGMGGVRAVTLKISISYRKMVRVQQPLKLIGWRTIRKGRKLYLRAELRDYSNVLLSEARGLFLEIMDPRFLTAKGLNQTPDGP
ncbi:PaaI family thioesterase [bacterium]|nr:PaaI family thioesterase [bacterium]